MSDIPYKASVRVFLLVASGLTSVWTKVAWKIQSTQGDLSRGACPGGGCGVVVRYMREDNVYFVCRLCRHCRHWEGATTPAMPTETSERTDDKSTLASYR